MCASSPKPGQIARLVAFLPQLYMDGFCPVVRWGGGTTKPDGTFTMAWPVYDQIVERFFQVAAAHYWTDYEYDPREAEHMLEDEVIVKRASLSEVKTMLTYCVRGERFASGHWAEMIERGHIRRLLERLVELKSPARPRHYRCPHCGQTTARRIVYGYPTDETMTLATRGEIVLGGCCPLIEDPNRACVSCRYRWNSKTGVGAVVQGDLPL